MLIAKSNIREAVIDELSDRTRLSADQLEQFSDTIDDEIALSKDHLTVAEIATEVILQEKLAEF